MQSLICPTCNKTFQTKKFGKIYCCHRCKIKANGDTYYSRNTEKVRRKTSEYQRNHPEMRNKKNLKHTLKKFNLTIDDYNKMFKEQDGRCGCCGKHQSELEKRLHIDHCHDTDKVRGLLCWECNASIGKLGDNLDGVLKAVSYLEKFENV